MDIVKAALDLEPTLRYALWFLSSREWLLPLWTVCFTQLAIKIITFTFHYDLEISGNLYLYFWSIIVQTLGRYVAHVPMKTSKVHADTHKKLPVFVRNTVQKKIGLFLFTDSTTSIVPTACTNSWCLSVIIQKYFRFIYPIPPIL